MILDEPPRGGYLTPDLLSLSGLEQLQAIEEGRVARPPIHYLTGMRPTVHSAGTSTFVMPATGWLASHYGVVTGGILAALADGPLGCAIQTTLPAGTAYTTSELSMSYLRPGATDGGLLRCDGKVISRGRSLALSDAVVTDAEGRELAHATSRCFLFPPVRDLPPRPDLPVLAEPAYDTPAPYEREPEGTVLGAELDGLSGYDVWTRCADGTFPPPPVHYLTGAMPTEVGEGTTTWTMPATPWLCSPLGMVEGGMLVYLADCAVASASATLAPTGTTPVPIDVTAKFVRPVPPDGRDLTAHGRVVHHGRTISVAAADVRNADGKLVCTALGSSMIVPGNAFSGR